MLSTILLILFLILVLFRRQILAGLLFFFMGKLAKKMQEQAQDLNKDPQESRKQKSSQKMGEYIDYDEIE
jgi:hypothetical protein